MVKYNIHQETGILKLLVIFNVINFITDTFVTYAVINTI